MMLLDADHLRFSYGTQRVIDDVSLKLSAGEVVTLIGPNGSGKSTLIKLLLDLVRGQGSIRWMDRPLQDWPVRERARRIAYLPQSPVTDDEQTVLDVLRLGRMPYLGAFGIERDTDMRVIGQISQMLDLDRLLDRRMAELSGGQRQRVVIGRCLVQQPAVLVLDEPHTYLDLRYQVELSMLLRRLSREQNLGILIAGHDLNLASNLSDRLILLNQGRVVSHGPPSQVLDPTTISRVYELPLDRIDRPGKPPLIFPQIEP